MDEYWSIWEAVNDTRPELIADFDAHHFATNPPSKMADWLDELIPIKGGWHWRLVTETAHIIRNVEKYT